jgi:hypothetical protein
MADSELGKVLDAIVLNLGISIFRRKMVRPQREGNLAVG